jgi:RNA polymerase sigma-54 factor
VILVDPAERMIGAALIDALDEAGYLVGSLDEIAERLGATRQAVERTLLKLQACEPTGVFARSLAECLELQLRERDRFDPAMEAMIANLPALARRDFALLRKVCGVDDEDLADMIAEIRRLEPKPGRAFGDPPGPPAIPDVHVVAAPDRTWRVELNSQALPRVLVNEVYASVIRRGASREEDKQYVSALAPVGQLADQEPRAARPHHPQRRHRNRAPAGRLPGRRRVGAKAPEPQDDRRVARRPRVDRVPRHRA